MVHTQKPANCLSMFDHFVGLALKELTNEKKNFVITIQRKFANSTSNLVIEIVDSNAYLPTA